MRKADNVYDTINRLQSGRLHTRIYTVYFRINRPGNLLYSFGSYPLSSSVNIQFDYNQSLIGVS